jgi:hypothetical protein
LRAKTVRDLLVLSAGTRVSRVVRSVLKLSYLPTKKKGEKLLLRSATPSRTLTGKSNYYGDSETEEVMKSFIVIRYLGMIRGKRCGTHLELW